MIGNDDCGQMSAWYILSTLGFYPVNPASNELVLGAPQVKKAVLHLAKGKSFTIFANNFSNKNIYTQNAFLNGEKRKASFILYEEIMKGGTFTFEMQP